MACNTGGCLSTPEKALHVSSVYGGKTLKETGIFCPAVPDSLIIIYLHSI